MLNKRKRLSEQLVQYCSKTVALNKQKGSPEALFGVEMLRCDFSSWQCANINVLFFSFVFDVWPYWTGVAGCFVFAMDSRTHIMPRIGAAGLLDLLLLCGHMFRIVFMF